MTTTPAAPTFSSTAGSLPPPLSLQGMPCRRAREEQVSRRKVSPFELAWRAIDVPEGVPVVVGGGEEYPGAPVRMVGGRLNCRGDTVGRGGSEPEDDESSRAVHSRGVHFVFGRAG